MLFGYNTKPRTTVVVAGHTLEEFQAWFASLNHEGALYTAARETEMFEHLMNDEWTDLKTTVYVFDFDHDYNQAEFARLHDIVILPRMEAIDRNGDMDYLSRGDDMMNETRTIAEIFNLGDDDPYDKRSDAEKAADKIMSERMKQLQKDDQISSDSFAPVTKGGVAVTDIHASTNADGTVSIDGINAVKYKGDEAEEARKQMERVRQEGYVARRTALQEAAQIVDLTAENPVLTVTEAPIEEEPVVHAVQVDTPTPVEDTSVVHVVNATQEQAAEVTEKSKSKRKSKAKE
jgi:hypothetical protein